MTQPDDPKRQQIRTLIQMGAKEFTGGDIAAFLQAAQPDADSLSARILIEETDDSPAGPRPTRPDLEADAARRGLADDLHYFLALGLAPDRAYFCAWYKQPKADRQPATITGLARFLGFNNRTTIYKWIDSLWFNDLGIKQARRRQFLDSLPQVDRMTITEAETQTGAVGVAARGLFYKELGGVMGEKTPGEDEQHPVYHKMVVLPPKDE